MKKILLGLSAFIMMFAASCEQQEWTPNLETEATVSFNVATPQIAVKAYSDGATATQLQYAVYDENGNILKDLTKTDETINGSATVELQLTTGNKYSVIFWAAAEGAEALLLPGAGFCPSALFCQFAQSRTLSGPRRQFPGQGASLSSELHEDSDGEELYAVLLRLLRCLFPALQRGQRNLKRYRCHRSGPCPCPDRKTYRTAQPDHRKDNRAAQPH